MLQNRLFAALASRSGFGAAVSEAVVRSSIVLQLSRCRSHCSGCVKVAWCRGCMRNTIDCFLQLDLVNSIGVAASRLRQ